MGRKMYKAQAEPREYQLQQQQYRAAQRAKLQDELTKLADEEAIARALRASLGMPIPKEIVANATLLKDEGEMSDADYEALIGEYAIVDKDAETKRLK